jgi:dihydropyrimidinase
MATLIKNGTLVTAEKTFRSDILIQDEKITRVAPTIEADSALTIDASGKLILPGGVDPHVHLDLPMFNTVSSDDHYTGHKAAAFGGTTTVMDFVPLDSPLLLGEGSGVRSDEGDFKYSIDLWLKKAQKAAIDYSFHMNLTSSMKDRRNRFHPCARWESKPSKCSPPTTDACDSMMAVSSKPCRSPKTTECSSWRIAKTAM